MRSGLPSRPGGSESRSSAKSGRALVMVGGGGVFRELVEAVKEHQGALPVGTGPGVGVVGYLVNGGLSGYFSRRLGLLGQRVTRLTVVTAAGEIRVLEPDDGLLPGRSSSLQAWRSRTKIGQRCSCG